MILPAVHTDNMAFLVGTGVGVLMRLSYRISDKAACFCTDPSGDQT